MRRKAGPNDDLGRQLTVLNFVREVDGGAIQIELSTLESTRVWRTAVWISSCGSLAREVNVLPVKFSESYDIQYILPLMTGQYR